jgi:hypothetical protein
LQANVHPQNTDYIVIQVVLYETADPHPIQNPMRRSTQVAAPLLAAAALSLLSGCRQPEMQRCVDEHNNVVPDSFCEDQKNQPTPQQRSDGHGGFIPFFPMYRYYFGGLGGYALGSHAEGGAFRPTPGRTYATTTRGGFGSSFGGEAEGGHGSAGE